MFRQAYEIARQFTFPVIVSRKTGGGKCSSSIATFVIVNDDGWVVTACHVIELINKLGDEAAAFQQDPDQAKTAEMSVWWGKDGVEIKECYIFPEADIAVGQLQPFVTDSIKTYPTFKDPAKDFGPGTSLCKLGYPFHGVTPIWDEPTRSFKLPEGATPIPLFPIDGIFTRTAAWPEQPKQYPVKFVETSTPGLRGQSGGPIFDVKGSIWAIQSHTEHYALGFSPQVSEAESSEKEHQFLGVGRGAHAETVLGFFNEKGIKYNISSY